MPSTENSTWQRVGTHCMLAIVIISISLLKLKKNYFSVFQKTSMRSVKDTRLVKG